MSSKRKPAGRARPLRLRTAEGIRRRTLPRVVSGDGRRPSKNALDLVVEALRARWKTFRKRMKRGLPRRAAREDIDEAVHDLRTASRRLLSVLESADAVDGGKAVRRLSRRLSRVLDRLGPVRDLAVEKDTLWRVLRRRSAPGIRSFRRRLDRDYRKSVRRARRDLDREDLRDLREERKRIERRLRAAGKDSRERLLEAARASCERLKERRAEVDPNQIRTLHQTRIALKKFRYLLEAIAPVLPEGGESALEPLHALQTTMGDLHDIEVLSAALSRHGKKKENPGKLAPILAQLEAEHSALLKSFLKTADPILDFWSRTLG
jgi:CHAD domain-containing protein